MKKFSFKKIVSLFLALMMLVGMMSISVFAETETQTEESEQVVYKNVWIGEKIDLMFALPTADVEGKDVVITANGDVVPQLGTQDFEGVAITTYKVANGVAAQNIDRIYNVNVEIDGETVANFTYSVLEFLYERLYVDGVTGAEKDMLNDLIAFADSADKFINEDATGIAGKYVYVNTVDCTFDGGKTAGVVAKDTVIDDLVADFELADGQKYVWNVKEFGASDAGNDYSDEQMLDGEIVASANIQISVTAVDSDVVVIGELATFEFGANGSASHYDGSEKTTYTDTVNGYTLSIINGVKMYTGARDAKGNSCIKFGTGTASVIGSMQFVVPENVTEVQIYVAKYKAKTTKVTINGTTYTLTNSSDNGQYDVITIDTTTNKTVKFTTVSGSQRAMLNTITFFGVK